MAANQGDLWKVSGEDRTKHDSQFFQLKPVNGYVTGNQARDFFMQSGLPTQVLGQIWGLADINGDGKMDKKEFSVAMHLIKKKLQGYALPKVLPASLKADPSPVIGSLGQSNMNTSMGMNFSMGGPGQMGGMPLIQPQAPQASLGTSTMTTGSLGGIPRMANGGAMPLGTGTAPVPIPSGGSIWAMPHNSKLKHTQTFNANDRNKRGYLLGVEGRSLLMQSGLPQGVLAQIWMLSDVDQDGKLTCDEFCIAMHLIELARMGHAMPPSLPAELVPTKARSGSVTASPPAPGTPKKDAFGDLLGGMDLPKGTPVIPIVPAAAQSVEEVALDEQVTFEDKRKENFDKGQAELERRRALLREQQQAEANARLEKERQEAAKRERQRLEAESKRQAELQRQLEKQREKEREIEEQRRKMVEQREAARRDLERRRQMEWEAQRKEQLLQEKQREYEQLSVLKTQMALLKADLESLDGKKTELSLKITQVQAGVADFTSSIDGMRVSRDKALGDIELYDRQAKELDTKMAVLGSEKDGLNVQVQTVQATPMSDAHRTVSSSVDTKRLGIQKLKKDVESLESDTEARLGEIDCNNAELKNLKDQLAKLQTDLPRLQKQQEERLAQQKKTTEELQQKQRQEKERQDKLKREIEQQQQKAQKPQASIPATSEPNWFDFNSKDAGTSASTTSGGGGVNWDSAFSGGTSSDSLYGNVSSAWGTSDSSTTAGSTQKVKYKALYDFAATREDELSFSSGQEIMVWNEEPVAGMEDWCKGETNNSTGWFPKSYVEKVEASQPISFGSAFEPVTQSSSSSSSQSQSNDLFSTNFSKPEPSSAIQQLPSALSATSSSGGGSGAPSPALQGSQGSSEGLLAKATYPWKARQESDLTFDKDDVILVQKQEEMRWFGSLNGKSGWFPKAYVKLIGVAPKTESDQVTEEDSLDHLEVSAKNSTGGSSQPEVQNGGGDYYVALYTYTSDEPNDLTFNEGDMILITGKNGDWWSGTIPEQGKTGIFPANYVKKLDIQPSTGSCHASLGKAGNVGVDPFPPVFEEPPKTATTTTANTNTTSSSDPFGSFDFTTASTSSVSFASVSSSSTFNANKMNEFDGSQSFGNTTSTSSDQATYRMMSQTSSSLSSAANEDVWNADAMNESARKGTDSSLSSAFTSDPFASMENAFDSDPFGNDAGQPFGGSDPFGNVDNTFGNTANADNTFGNTASANNAFGKVESFGNDDEIARAFKTSASTDNMSAFGEDPFGDITSPGSATGNEDPFGAFGNLTTTQNALVADTTDGRSKSSIGPAQVATPVNQDGLEGSATGKKSKSLDNLFDDVMAFDQTGSVFGMGLTQVKGKVDGHKEPQIAFTMTPEIEADVSAFSLTVPESPEQKSSKKPEIARVIASYVATGTGQLSLDTGNLINVRQKSPRGWWEGELQVRGQKKKIGWFPANYVKLLGPGSARSTPEPSAMANLAVGSTQDSRSATPQSIASQDGVAGINQPETVVALYAYQAQNDDELTFQKDSVITVLSRDNPDWWNGQLDGVTGVFPSNYVTPNPQSQSWMNDTVQEEMTKSERKRQQVIQELIATEESYNNDMAVALEVFKKPMVENKVLPVEHVNLIFVNWEELIVCNKKFLQALRVRKKMSGTNGVIHIIGDLMCESIPHMNPYMRFCSCQLTAAAALQRASENFPAFQEFHKACMQNPKVKGVHLSGFLLKPMQRITRYPLLVEKVLAHTPPEHADRTNVEEALTLAQELCAQANQCVKEKQNSDHLEWIQAHVHCDGLAENITFNSLTNCLGPRRLLFTGILYKAKSSKELVGFLFNDIFLLAQTSRPLGTNFSSLHLFDTNMQFKMYRLPIFLNEVSVKKCPDDTEPTQFQITSDRILNLKAVSSIERETWIRELEQASKNYKDKAKRKLERAHSAQRANPVGRVLVVVEEGVGLWCPDGTVKRPNVGRIVVVIQEAAHLKAADANGKSDPYCEVSMGSQEHRTKVIPGTVNPRWNASMQFFIRDVERDTLCFTVQDRDLFSPNDFLGRTEVRIKDVLDESGGERRGPITKRLILHEVETGEVVVKLDLLLYES